MFLKSENERIVSHNTKKEGAASEIEVDEHLRQQKQLNKYASEIEQLHEQLSKYKKMKSCESQQGFEQLNHLEQNSLRSDQPNFAEPTEAEYLRNVLFRYMTERETLGKEIVVSTFLHANFNFTKEFGVTASGRTC